MVAAYRHARARCADPQPDRSDPDQPGAPLSQVEQSQVISDTHLFRKFTKVINLPVGRHTYKFKVDSKWTINPLKPITLNGYGGYNNVVEIVPFDPKTTSEDPLLVNESTTEF